MTEVRRSFKTLKEAKEFVAKNFGVKVKDLQKVNTGIRAYSAGETFCLTGARDKATRKMYERLRMQQRIFKINIPFKIYNICH